MELTATNNVLSLSKGYKQTEVGLIPEDWNMKAFKDIFKVNQGLQIAIEQRRKLPSKNSKKYITIQYLNDGKQVEYIDDYSSSVCCEIEDVLMTRTGNTGMVITNVTGVFHNNFFKINFNRKKLDKDFIVYFLKQNSTQKKILEKAGTSTIPDLNHNDFYSLKIPLPPTLSEQKAIAQVLSDTDALIQALEKKIAKKKLIKKGVMQKLLTPMEGWAIKTLSEVFIISSTSSKKAFFKDGGKYIVMDMGSVSVEGKILNYKRAICNFDILRKGDLVMPKDDIGGGNIIGKVGYIDNDDSYVLSDHVYKLSLSCNEVNPLFMAYVINDYRVNSSLRSKASGSAQLGLGRSQVLNQEISYPKKEEQNQIAQTLFDMDEEIEILKQKLSKYKLAKQGMMQQLLTGKIRLV